VAAIGVWELANAAIQRHLQVLSQGAQAVRSARLRTLLPLLRTSLFIAICIVVSLMVLSEIGVNIAPLLAGPCWPAPVSWAWRSASDRRSWCRT
jgi:small conductance mechanosensitive channel